MRGRPPREAKTPVVSQPGQREAPNVARAAPAKKSSRWIPMLVWLAVLILVAAGVFILIKGH